MLHFLFVDQFKKIVIHNGVSRIPKPTDYSTAPFDLLDNC
jgi:hypothetical protein